ncbi:SGNH/GDSL hydrolase family protein [Mesorhizobium sp. STM 4661]|uniref:SGNH/GDSL hydrolase family protein n=1 Tax=Mesorhizobium sp. STM 4661 TaxID=1297570 RepID=UPI0002BEA1CD|nr:SGNH/GDSL hydrolase family protein [Mesorhizobium sp. STM 4661]CCV12945.1 hypothetical protein MESS4_510112 [Mesorhizobium sp. STM 4661]
MSFDNTAILYTEGVAAVIGYEADPVVSVALSNITIINTADGASAEASRIAAEAAAVQSETNAAQTTTDRGVVEVVAAEFGDLGSAMTAITAAVSTTAGNAATTISNAASTAADVVSTHADAASAALAKIAAGFFPLSAAANVPRGISNLVGAITAGSGGTTGNDFALTWSGGNFSVNPTGVFDVAGGIVTAVRITGPGEYIGAAPSAPTPGFGASAGLTGAAVALTVTFLAGSGQSYWALSSDGFYNQLYKNNAGTSLIVAGVTTPTKASIDLNIGNMGVATLGQVPAPTTGAITVGTNWYVIPVAIDVNKVVDILHVSGNAGPVWLYAGTKSGSNFTILRSKRLKMAAGVNALTGVDFSVFAGEYLMVYAPLGLYKTTGLGAGVDYWTATTTAVIPNSAFALTVTTGSRFDVGVTFKSLPLNETTIDHEAALTRQRTLGMLAADVVASTGWSAAVFMCPMAASQVDGFLTSMSVYGTSAGDIMVRIMTRNSDGTFTVTGAIDFSVAAGKVTVTPNLPIAKGQFVCWRHTGTSHYDGSNTGETVSYFNTEPTVNSTRSAAFLANLQFSATVEPTIRGVGTTLTARMVTAEAIGNTSVLGMAAASVAASTAWSGLVWILPKERSPADGFLTSLTLYGTSSGLLTVLIATKNTDGTFTITAQAEINVAAGKVTVAPDLPIAKGQYVCWQHTGVQHYDGAGTGIVTVGYFNAKPTTNTAQSAQLIANLQWSATIEGTYNGLRAVSDRRLNVLEIGPSSTSVLGKAAASVAAASPFSNLYFISPQVAVPYNGFLSSLTVYGTTAGTVTLAILTKNLDGTFTTTATGAFSVGAGKATIVPNLPVIKGQYLCWKHSGSNHYTAATGIPLFYFATQPSVNTPIFSQLLGALEYSATIDGVFKGVSTILSGLTSNANVDWVGLDGDCIGTSLTAGDDWITLVKNGLGLATLVDHGVGGGKMAKWDHPTGGLNYGGEILAAVANINPLSKIVFAEFGVNDWWNGAPLGVPSDRLNTAAGTYYGGMRELYAAIHARAPGAMIVVMADWNTSSNVPPYTQESEDQNTVGRYPWEYQEAMRISAMMNGLLFVPLYMLRGFWTPTEYQDHVHPPVGNPQLRTAKFILNTMRGISPLS